MGSSNANSAGGAEENWRNTCDIRPTKGPTAKEAVSANEVSDETHAAGWAFFPTAAYYWPAPPPPHLVLERRRLYSTVQPQMFFLMGSGVFCLFLVWVYKH